MTPGRDQYSGQRSILQAENNTPGRDQYSRQGSTLQAGYQHPKAESQHPGRVSTQGQSINSGTGHDEVRWLSGSPGTKMMHDDDDDDEGEV